LAFYDELHEIFGKDTSTGKHAISSMHTIIGNIIDLMTLILEEHPAIDSKLRLPAAIDLNLKEDPELMLTSDSPTSAFQKDDSGSDEDDDDVEELLIKKGLQKKRSLSTSSRSGTSAKSRRISVYQTATDITAEGMHDLSEGIANAFMAPQQPPITWFDQCLPILNDMRAEGELDDSDYFRYSTLLMKDERLAALFFRMTEDLRLTWLKEYNK